jgi:hypothetical protein
LPLAFLVNLCTARLGERILLQIKVLVVDLYAGVTDLVISGHFDSLESVIELWAD